MNDGIWKYFKNIGEIKARIYFINKCKQFHLIPKGFHSKPVLRSMKSNHLETRFAKIRMNERLNQIHAKLFTAELHVSTSLQSNPLPEDIMQDLHETTFKAYNDTTMTHCRKFHDLLSSKPHLPPTPMQYKLDAVLNLSSKTFTRDELRILSLGFNFRPSLPAFPTQDYILATEAHIKSANLSSEDSALLRNVVVNELERMHKNLAYVVIFSLEIGLSLKLSKPTTPS